jgi:hypothetical protein
MNSLAMSGQLLVLVILVAFKWARPYGTPLSRTRIV